MSEIILVGHPDDVTDNPNSVPALERYSGKVFTELQRIMADREDKLYTLVLTHHSCWRGWNTQTRLERDPHTVDFSFTRATRSLNTHLAPMWWPSGLKRILVDVADAYLDIVQSSTEMRRLDGESEITVATGTPTKRLKALKEWMAGYMPENRLKRYMVIVSHDGTIEFTIRRVWATCPAEAQRLALHQVFVASGWQKCTAQIPEELDNNHLYLAQEKTA